MTRLKMQHVLAAAIVLFAAPSFPYSGEIFVTCGLDPNGDNFLALRECESTKCDMIMRLPPDTYVFTMEPNSLNGWREIVVMDSIEDESFSGPSGWVYGKYICEPSFPYTGD